MGLNFNGNQSVEADPAIKLATLWHRDAETKRYVPEQANESSRGRGRRSWPVETIVDRGYALVTACYHDIFPDFSGGFPDSVESLYSKPGQTEREADEWDAIGAWAWGLSRMLDYLETDADVDATRVAVMGHSRLGKTALWAGAQDPRFAVVISNDSGCGGAALSRRAFGETVAIINNSFPHWFALNFRKYGGHEADLPVDQHMLIALIAPRPVYVASAEEDQWADPRGEFLSLKAAEPVYLLLGTDGLGADEMPAVDQPVARTMGYHIRSGRHAVTAFDWQQYLDFADRHLQKKAVAN